VHPGNDFASFGPVHLDVVDRDRSLQFWRDVVGLRLRRDDENALELGTERETLLVLHPGATSPTRHGYAGLYHLAIHLPNEPEFARMLARLIVCRWPIAPTDHTMSKAIYLDDPDGIGLELTLETPERQRSMRVVGRSMEVIDADGRLRSGRDPLDVEEVLATLPDRNFDRPVPEGTTVGHMHLHVADLDAALAFYRDAIGFIEHMHAPQFGMSDLHAGGRFQHRMALNVWQGRGVSQPPSGTAGLRHFTIRFDSPERLAAVVGRIPAARNEESGYRVHDPSGNVMMLTA
jgi:catechol 2,3-dioxygenase